VLHVVDHCLLMCDLAPEGLKQLGSSLIMSIGLGNLYLVGGSLENRLWISRGDSSKGLAIGKVLLLDPEQIPEPATAYLEAAGQQAEQDWLYLEALHNAGRQREHPAQTEDEVAHHHEIVDFGSPVAEVIPQEPVLAAPDQESPVHRQVPVE
jgi:hypothetical protein